MQANLSIPDNVRVVFIFSTGQKEFLNRKFYNELSEIYFWLSDRSEEFQNNVNILSAVTKEGKISVLEISYNGEKRAFDNLDLKDYQLRNQAN